VGMVRRSSFDNPHEKKKREVPNFQLINGPMAA
jgi:hypothetical protein